MTVRERAQQAAIPGTDHAPVRRPTGFWWGLVLVLLLVASVAAGAWWLRGGDDVVVVQPAQPPAAQPVAPAPVAVAPLSVTVTAPDEVVAGEPARFVVHYADGAGIFSGSVEDWGDVGAGSAKQASCATAPAAGPLQASYATTHTWSEAGSYPVRVDVTTYTCEGGTATSETRGVSLTVEVSAAS